MSPFVRGLVALKTGLRFWLAGIVLIAITGCATGPGANARDPLEPLNRGVFAFNDAADRLVYKPAATVYRHIVPQLVRRGVSNFFDNLGGGWSAANSLLQLDLQSAAESFMRLSANTVIGVGGVFDVASEMGIPRHREDFGQTLGRWGVPTGPYLVLPLFGPSTLRDVIALPVDYNGNLVTSLNDVAWRNTLTVLDIISTRSGLFTFDAAIDAAALDRYSFVRDAYLQRRRNNVFDGDPPEEDVGRRPAER